MLSLCVDSQFTDWKRVPPSSWLVKTVKIKTENRLLLSKLRPRNENMCCNVKIVTHRSRWAWAAAAATSPLRDFSCLLRCRRPRRRRRHRRRRTTRPRPLGRRATWPRTVAAAAWTRPSWRTTAGVYCGGGGGARSKDARGRRCCTWAPTAS